MKDFKKTISFIDKDNHKAIINLGLTHRNNYPEFTASGRYCGSWGQCLDHIKPITAHQRALIRFWNKYHLKEINEGNLFALNNIIAKIEEEETKRQKEEDQKDLTEDEKLLQQMEEHGIDEDQLDACKAYLDYTIDDDLADFEESYSGQFDSDADFAKEQAESCGSIDNQAHWPNNCIDWEQASSELMMDYYEQDGYYFRQM